MTIDWGIEVLTSYDERSAERVHEASAAEPFDAMFIVI
jgi:hypothetical protein